jgi:peptidoglycan/LPS O-acetylase OafA/YrhL
VAATLSDPAGTAPSPAVTPPPGNPRFALFESLRAFAVLAVILFHVASLTNGLSHPVIGPVEAELGSLGPLLFFVISGFLLFRPYLAARAAGRGLPSVTRYGRRRVLRIVPAYWLALTVLAIFPGVVGAFSGDWWRYYFFLQLYSARTLGGGIPVAWTLCVEVSFYLVLPLWALAMARLTRGVRPDRRWRWDLGALAIIAAAGALVQVLAARQHVSHLVSESIAGECTWLALGMAFAVMSVAAEGAPRSWTWLRRVAARPGWCWIAAAAALAGLAATVPAGSVFTIAAELATVQPLVKTVLTIVLTGVFLALLVAPAVFGDREGGLPRQVMAWRPLAWIGLVSYGMYLWHLPLLEWVTQRGATGHFSASGLGWASSLHHGATAILFAGAVAGSAAIAALSYRYVELPFLRRKER